MIWNYSNKFWVGRSCVPTKRSIKIFACLSVQAKQKKSYINIKSHTKVSFFNIKRCSSLARITALYSSEVQKTLKKFCIFCSHWNFAVGFHRKRRYPQVRFRFWHSHPLVGLIRPAITLHFLCIFPFVLLFRSVSFSPFILSSRTLSHKFFHRTKRNLNNFDFVCFCFGRLLLGSL